METLLPSPASDTVGNGRILNFLASHGLEVITSLKVITVMMAPLYLYWTS